MIKVIRTWFSPTLKYPLMRQPDRSSRCDEMTDEERLEKVKQWNNRNVWNTFEYSEVDRRNFK